MITSENTPEKEEKLTWLQWQLLNWWYIPIIGFIVAGWLGYFYYETGVIGVIITHGIAVIMLLKGVIYGWKEYKEGRTS